MRKKKRQLSGVTCALVLVISLVMAGVTFAADVSFLQEAVTDATDAYTEQPAEDESPSETESTEQPETPSVEEPATKEPETETPTSAAPEKPTKENPETTAPETTGPKEEETATSEEYPTDYDPYYNDVYDDPFSDPGYDVYENIGVVMNSKPERFGTLYWPLPSEYGLNSITSGYGYRTGTYSGMHAGLDIGAPEGTPVYACEDGVVLESYFSNSAGNFTIIQHEGGLYTEYMHQSVRYVQKGDVVKAGQLIGLVGSTGWSTGPHLHIGVVISDSGYSLYNRVDPTPYLTLLNKLDPSLNIITEQNLTIKYADGKKLSDVVSESAEQILKLEPLFTKNKIQKISYAGFEKKGYVVSEYNKQQAEKVISLPVKAGYDRYENTWIKYEGEDYDILVTLEASYNSTERNVPVAFRLGTVGFSVNRAVYKKSDLEKKIYKNIKNAEGNYFAVGLHVEVYKHGTEQRIELPDVYQSVKDVDNAQSFRCLNEPYAAESLFVKNHKAFDTNDNDNDKQNKITNEGDIYSEFSVDPVVDINNPGTADLYRKTEKLSSEGLSLVYGFGEAEYTGIDFFIPKYTISFNAGKGGKVNVKSVQEISGDSLKTKVLPKAKAGYKFVKWVTDQDVMFADTQLKAGDTITMEQIQEIIVTDDLSFTAKFKKDKTDKKSKDSAQTQEPETAKDKIAEETEETKETKEDETTTKAKDADAARSAKKSKKSKKIKSKKTSSAKETSSAETTKTK